jgi:glutaconate CoA-transferase subunit A
MNKVLTASEAVGRLKSGMTVGVGGWGARRKPMALVREILRSDLRDLTLVAFGGPEVGMLAASGKLKRLVYGFVSLDFIPLEPFFRKARESGNLPVSEFDEGMVVQGLRAAAWHLPFLPTRVGLGTAIMKYNPQLKTVTSPYDDGETFVAMPALKLDAALIHVNRADRLGNTQSDGPDPYFDELFARAADFCIASTETLVDRLDKTASASARSNLVERACISAVVNAPGGAHPTSAPEDYGWDQEHFRAYTAAAADPAGFEKYRADFLGGGEADYIAKVGGLEKIRRLPPVRL